MLYIKLYQTVLSLGVMNILYFFQDCAALHLFNHTFCVVSVIIILYLKADVYQTLSKILQTNTCVTFITILIENFKKKR